MRFVLSFIDFGGTRAKVNNIAAPVSNIKPTTFDIYFILFHLVKYHILVSRIPSDASAIVRNYELQVLANF